MFKYKDPWYIILSRTTLATVFILSGLSGFTSLGSGFFTPDPSLVGNIQDSPHFFALKATELIIGVAFLSNFFIQTVLLVALPIVSSVILYHFWVDPTQGLISMLLIIPMIGLFRFYKQTYRVFFKPQAYSDHMAEDSTKILAYDEVREKAPKKISSFEAIYQAVNR